MTVPLICVPPECEQFKVARYEYGDDAAVDVAAIVGAVVLIGVGARVGGRNVAVGMITSVLIGPCVGLGNG